MCRLLNTKLKFSSAFHPQTDDQTEVVNRSLGDLLRCLVGDMVKTWDLILPMAEFEYNSSVNRTTGRSPFEIVLGLQPRKPIDLVPLPILDRPSAKADAFADHIRNIHADVRRKIALRNISYNKPILHRRHIEFEVGDQVMVRVRPKRFPTNKYRKFQYHSVGPYKILKKINSNAYVLDLPDHICTTSILKILLFIIVTLMLTQKRSLLLVFLLFLMFVMKLKISWTPILFQLVEEATRSI